MGETITAESVTALEELLRDRWSCRAFLADEVPRPLLQRLFDTSQRAPSWCNTQPWQVELLSGAAIEVFRAELRAYVSAPNAERRPDFDTPTGYSGVYRERRRTSGWQLYDSVGIEKDDRIGTAAQAAKNLDFFGAPHLAVITVPVEQATYGAVDTGIYVGTLLLAAQSLGIAAIPQAALADYSPFIREHLRIGDDRRVVLVVALGYADAEDPVNGYRTERAGIDLVVSFHDEVASR